MKKNSDLGLAKTRAGFTKSSSSAKNDMGPMFFVWPSFLLRQIHPEKSVWGCLSWQKEFTRPSPLEWQIVNISNQSMCQLVTLSQVVTFPILLIFRVHTQLKLLETTRPKYINQGPTDHSILRYDSQSFSLYICRTVRSAQISHNVWNSVETYPFVINLGLKCLYIKYWK
jgi:hypothetical protein